MTAVRMRRSEPEATIAAGEDAFARGDIASAQALFESCTQDPTATSTQVAQALNDLAVIAVGHGRPGHAERLLLDALARDSSYLPALENLASWCETRGDLVQATHWWRRVTQLAGDHSMASRQLAALTRPVQPPADPAGEPRAMLDPARVLIVADRFHPSVGGTEKLAESVGTALQMHGIAVDVLTRPMPERTSYRHRGMTIHELGGDVLGDLTALAQSGRYGALLAFSNATVWPIVATLRLPQPRPRLAVVPCVNAADSAELRGNGELLRAYAQLIAGADVIGYSSRTAYDARLLEDLGLPGVYVPNAVERVAVPASPAPTAAIAGEDPILLVVANLWPGKNHIGLLDALRARPGRWRVALIGDVSPEFPEHAAVVRAAAAADSRVHLLGPATPEGIAAAMDEAAALLLPSLAEATPLVLLEAMSRELPWIASPTSGSAHDHAGGLILPVELFGEGIDFLLSNPEHAARLGAAGHAHWQACYRWEIIGPRYAGMLRGETPGGLEAPSDALTATESVRAAFYDGRPVASR